MVFPVLYSELPDEYKWQSMEYLGKSLWCRNLFNELNLMRVGEYKPDIFGSNNVMPVQMAETARAYFKIGDFKRAVNLLESVALAGTIYTEAPGNFPERMSDNGKGEANYIFGNPIGSYIYTVVEGLFGLQVMDCGKTLSFRPAFPEEWDFADFKLPFLKVNYKRKISGNEKTKIYQIENEEQEYLDFQIFLEPNKLMSVSHNGDPVQYKAEAALNSTKISFKIINKGRNVVEIRYNPIEICDCNTHTYISGSNIDIEVNHGIAGVSDANDMMEYVRFKGNRLVRKLKDKTGEATIYVKLIDPNIVLPITIESRENYYIKITDFLYDYQNKKFTLKATVDALEPDSSCKMRVELLNYSLSSEVIFDKNNQSQVVFNFNQTNMLPEGVYTVKYSIISDDRVISSGKQRVDLKGNDELSDKFLRKYRDSKLEHLDLTGYLNSKTIYAMSRWRTDVPMIYYVDKLPDGKIETSYGTFKLNNKDGNYMCLLSKGSSDRCTGIPIDSKGINNATIEINRRVYNVSLFFAGEVESRHTMEKVGSIKLIYNDGSVEEISIRSGENIGSLYSHYASDNIEVKEPYEVWKGNSWDADSMDAYRIPCDPNKVLLSMNISVDLYDVSIGLMGVNLITA